MTPADAARDWEGEGLALRAASTRSAYRTWVRRLVHDHGEADVSAVSAVELANLVAAHTRGSGGARGARGGRAAEETAISAFRSLWAYLVQRGLVARNLIDVIHAEVSLVGKSDRQRRLPLPPALAALVERYVEDRRPRATTPSAWSADAGPFLRRPPSPQTARARRWVCTGFEQVVPRLLGGAPQLVPRGDLSLYSYRHAIASWVDSVRAGDDPSHPRPHLPLDRHRPVRARG